MVNNSLSYLLTTTSALLYSLVNSITCRCANSPRRPPHWTHHDAWHHLNPLHKSALEIRSHLWPAHGLTSCRTLWGSVTNPSCHPVRKRKTGYITSSGSYNIRKPTWWTTPPRSVNHASPIFTTRWSTTVIKHRSAPERRRYTRPGTVTTGHSNPRSARLGNSSSE